MIDRPPVREGWCGLYSARYIYREAPITYWPGPPAPAFPLPDEATVSPVVGVASVLRQGVVGDGTCTVTHAVNAHDLRRMT